MNAITIVPAILRTTFEEIETDWNKVASAAQYIHVDVIDGVFAGEVGFLDILQLKELRTDKIDLHMMVQTPGDYIDEIIELNPARCVFHIEAFTGKLDLPFVYNTIGEFTSSEMGLAINPETPLEQLEEYLPIVQYVLFMGYKPGIANQAINTTVFEKIKTFHEKHPNIRIAADGHVGKDTIGEYTQAGATILCANTAIFSGENPIKNMLDLELLANMVD